MENYGASSVLLDEYEDEYEFDDGGECECDEEDFSQDACDQFDIEYDH